MRTKKKGGIFLRIVAWTLVVSGVLLLVVSGGVAVYAARHIDTELDESLFESAGGDTVTRLYYHGQNGTPLAELDGYMAIEWEEESFSGTSRTLYTKLSDMSPYLPAAFVAIEDERYFTHDGVDVKRTLGAALNSVLHFRERFGGSTITQQLIKNIGGEKEVTARRKIKEMLRAVSLEKHHSKEEILEVYLNIVPLSQNCLGVGAASLAYFGKEASQLSLAEAASLAAITKAPTAYDPQRDPDANTARRDLVLDKMLELGMITEREHTEAKNTVLTLHPAKWQNQHASSWYTDTVIRDVTAALVEKGYTESAAATLVANGGLRIYTCMDPAVQNTLETHFTEKAFGQKGEGFCGAMTVIHPKTGHLLGVVGNIGQKQGSRVLNCATDTLRAPGSVLKPVALYAPAIDRGIITEATVFDDVPKDFSSGTPYPHNSPAVYSGLINTKTALTQSKNTVAIDIYHRLGAEKIYGTLVYDLGISSIVRKTYNAQGRPMTDLAPSPLALGQLTNGVTLREMTAAYQPLANGGVRTPCTSFLLVLDRNGNVLLQADKTEKRVWEASTASILTHMLSSVVEQGTAQTITLKNTVDTAGKTGTSGESRDKWFIGYTPYFVAGIWCGYEQGDRSVNDASHLKVWDAVMKELHHAVIPAGTEPLGFARASGVVACRVCRDSGHLCSDICHLDPRGDRGMTVWLKADQIPKKTCTCHVPVLYDTINGGVVMTPYTQEREGLTQVALLDIPWRDFPRQVVIADAEYVYRAYSGQATTDDSQPFFAATVPEGHYVGISARDSRQYNRLCTFDENTLEDAPLHDETPLPPDPLPPPPIHPRKKKQAS